MNLNTLILQHEAARRKRIWLREQGVEGFGTAEVELRRLAVWLASCSTIDATKIAEDELPIIESKIPDSLQLDDNYFEIVANKVVADWTRNSMIEVSNLPIEEYALLLGSASAEIEAAILQIEKPEFAKLKEANPHFNSAKQI